MSGGGGPQALAIPGLTRGLVAVESPAVWRLDTLFGRLAELSGGPATAVLTLAIRLVLEAQVQGEPACWITDRASGFYPPDAARGGVDLEALPVVRLATTSVLPKAADWLVRSGGFGLVVMDLGRHLFWPVSVQTRLAGLAKRHHAALLCLTSKPVEAPSLGSLVSLRAEARRLESEPGRFTLEAYVAKDKRHGEAWWHREIVRGPDGLR